MTENGVDLHVYMLLGILVYYTISLHILNSSPPGRNGCHFVDAIFSDAFSRMENFVF